MPKTLCRFWSATASKKRLLSQLLFNRPFGEGERVEGEKVDDGEQDQQPEILRKPRLGKDIAGNLRSQQGKAYDDEGGKVLDHSV